MLKRAKSLLSKLYRDEQGADMVEYVLIIAAVALPLVGVLIWYWHDFVQWVGEAWAAIKGGGETDPSGLPQH